MECIGQYKNNYSFNPVIKQLWEQWLPQLTELLLVFHNLFTWTLNSIMFKTFDNIQVIIEMSGTISTNKRRHTQQVAGC